MCHCENKQFFQIFINILFIVQNYSKFISIVRPSSHQLRVGKPAPDSRITSELTQSLPICSLRTKHWRLRRQETSASSDSPALSLPLGELPRQFPLPTRGADEMTIYSILALPLCKKTNRERGTKLERQFTCCVLWPFAKKRIWPEVSQLESFSETLGCFFGHMHGIQLPDQGWELCPCIRSADS